MSTRDLGLLALRLGVGGTLFSHGAQKLFGWFGGHGLDGTGQFLASQGFTPGRRSALLAGLGEAGGGAALALGLGTGPAAAAAAATMAVAGSTHAENGFFNTSGGFELPATFALVATSLALTGPGRISVDELTGHHLRRPWMTAVGFAAAAGSATYLVLKARRFRAEAADAAPEGAAGD